MLNLLSEREGLWYSARIQKQPKVKKLGSESVGKNVEVFRDEHGVTHISAQNKKDAWVALGYMMSKDRFTQLQLFPRLIRSEVSEFVGSSALSVDRAFNNLALDEAASSWASKLSAEEEELLSAFTSGINMQIGSLAQRDYPILFRYQNLPVDYWRNTNTLGIMKLWAYINSYSISDVVYQALVNEIGENEFHRLYGDKANIETLARKGDIRLDIAATYQQLMVEETERQKWLGTNELDEADLNLVLPPSKVTTQSTLLLSQKLGNLKWPSLFYEVHISLPDQEIYGLALVGTPFIVSGTNGKISWNFYRSAKDFINIQEDVSEEIVVVESQVPLKSGGSVPAKLALTKSGKPVVQINTKSVVIDWAGYYAASGSLNALMNLYTASSATLSREDEQSLSNLTCELQLASAKGENEEYLLRNSSFYPVSGVEIKGLEYERNTNKPSANWFKNKRLGELLDQRLRHSSEDLINMLKDETVYFREIRKPLISTVNQLTEKDWLDVNNELQSWDFRASQESKLPILFDTFANLLHRNTWDELLVFPHTVFPSDKVLLNLVANNPRSIYFDQPNSDERETASDILLQSLRESFQLNQVEFGNYPNWSWGSADKRQVSSYFESVYPRLLNISDVAAGGFRNALLDRKSQRGQFVPVLGIIFDMREDETLVYVTGLFHNQEDFLRPEIASTTSREWTNHKWRTVDLELERISSSFRERISITPISK